MATVKKLVTVKYVGHTQRHGSGHMVRCAGYIGRLIPYSHAAHDPGQDAAHTYAREVLLKDMTKQADEHGFRVSFMPGATDSYALPGQGGEAYVLHFLRTESQVSFDVVEPKA